MNDILRRALRSIVLTSIIFFNTQHICWAQSNSIQEKIITDPSISRRCEELLNHRKQKIGHKQRITYLIEHAKKLKNRTPDNKISIEERLSRTTLDLIKEAKLTTLQISHIEENIIRHGCPGLSL